MGGEKADLSFRIRAEKDGPFVWNTILDVFQQQQPKQNFNLSYFIAIMC